MGRMVYVDVGKTKKCTIVGLCYVFIFGAGSSNPFHMFSNLGRRNGPIFYCGS